MKYWDRDECRNLILGLCADAGINGVDVKFNKRKHLGTCSVRWDEAGATLIRKKIFLAEFMWTGEYIPAKWSLGKIIIKTSPEMRLLTMLHEVTHMILDHQRGRDASIAASPHGKDFQKLELGICWVQGWQPVYSRCPGYADHFVNLDDGRRWSFEEAQVLSEGYRKAKS